MRVSSTWCGWQSTACADRGKIYPDPQPRRLF